MKTYDAGGTPKLTTDYINNFVYENGVLSFFGSPEGRVVRNTSGVLEYQYAIADHQGNTRVVFSSVNTSEIHKATFENMTTDAQKFKSLTTNTHYWVNAPSAANNTTGGQYSLRLNSTYNATGSAPGIAAAKSLSVAPGDVVELEVYGYYMGSSGFGNTSQPIAALVASVASLVTTGMPAAEASAATSGINSAYSMFGSPPNKSDAAPSAYLNYILLDKNYKLLDMGWQPVPDSANGTKRKVAFTPRNIKEPGYMYVYLSYEGDGTNWVYFDDLQIKHTKNNVVQYNEYYPFGLQTSSSWTRENSNNNFLYNEGSELNKTTGWYETAYRGYDATLGRFMQVDPLAVLVANYSPYAYANCNPVLFNDPSGLLTESEVNDIINRLWNSPNGGRWSASDGYYYYKSQSEAFEAAVEYNNYHNSWGQTYYKSEKASREVFRNMQKNGNSYLPSPVHFKYEFNWTKKGPKYIGMGEVPDAQKGIWFEDKQGEFLFNHWINGGGKPLYFLNGEWGQYMRRNNSLFSSIYDYLKEDSKKRKTSGKIHSRINAVLDDNDYVTGYGMLHGTDRTVGGFEIWGDVTVTPNAVTYNVLFTWHDIINPNPKEDIRDGVFAPLIKLFKDAKDYEIHISWSENNWEFRR